MDQEKNLKNRKPLKQSEDLYVDCEQRYREIYDNTALGLYRTTPDGKIILVNTATLKMLGYSSLEDLQQRNLDRDGYSPDYSRETFKKIMQETGNLKGHEAIWKRKDGTNFYVRESAKAIKDKTGKVLYYDGVLEDITEKKRKELINNVLLKISHSAATISELNPLIQSIREHLSELIETTNFGVAIYNGIEGSYTFPYYIDQNEEVQENQLEMIPNSLTEYCRKQGKAVLVDSIIMKDLERDNKIELIGPDSKVWLGVPLITSNGTIGVMSLQSYENLRAYTNEDIEILDSVADSIAIVIEKKQAETALLESEEKFRTLYDNTALGLYRSTPNGEILMANQTIVNILGYDSREELMSINLGDGHYTSDYGREQFKKEMREKGEIKGLEVKWKRKTGEEIYIRESARAFHDENGKIVYYDGVVEDITDKKQIENALQESEQRLSLALESTNLGLWDLNNKTGKVYRNDIWAEMLGYSADEVKNDMNFFENIVHPDDIQELRDKSKTAAKYLDVKFDVEHRMRTKDGNWKWIRDWGKVIEWDDNQKPVRIIGTHLDIDEEKKMQLALKESEEKFRKLFESSTDFMCVMDLKGTFTDVNPAAERITGYTRDVLIGLNFIEYATPKTKIKLLRAFKNYLKDEISLIDFPIEVNIQGKGIRHFECSIVPIWEGGKTVGFQGSSRDITHRINSEKQLLEQQDHIKVINRILRHDITNCLAIMQSAINIYIRINDKNMLDEVSRQIRKGTELIGKMRQLEESYITKMDLKQYSLKKVVEKIVKNIRSMKINVLGDGLIVADEALDSAIENIIANVVKHAKATEVDISIKEKYKFCLLSIADNGKGISDEVKEKIFIESYKSGSTGNTGLGLFIVKKTIERYGGSVRVKDNKPKGTIFELKLPRE
jgi:PAS domain S-box-containing protein